jgi:hypothetical protein
MPGNRGQPPRKSGSPARVETSAGPSLIEPTLCKAGGRKLRGKISNNRRWDSGVFRAATVAGRPRLRLGWVWRSWGIWYPGRGRFVVTHAGSAYRVTEFPCLAIARRFCERIDPLAEWASAKLPEDPDLGLRMHRIAIDLTGATNHLTAIGRREC